MLKRGCRSAGSLFETRAKPRTARQRSLVHEYQFIKPTD